MEDNWKKLLEGGFCFCIDNIPAPFAVHHYDRERANKMLSICKQEKISKQQVLDYAEQYLEGKDCKESIIENELKRVDKFVGSKLD